ncbi:MAG: molybdopterin-synthase adenylyltransferase MoeB [Candidatus Eremiobacteraeota bacterium]|nr:molybdopterin-synthase adenylyltransferase MoeB [Candidatus Eremiobacteraeota bacterium]
MHVQSLRRYSRHLLIPEVGLAGQERLARARVLVVGAGGLGSPVLAYLAAAGVGRLGVIDDDVVDVTNLQRQILYQTGDVGQSKAQLAAERLHALNPQIAIDALAVRFDAANARELVRLYDVVVDGTDTFSTRYLINDACVLEGKPDVYGSIFRFDGQVSIFGVGDAPCYRCLYPEPPPPETVPTCAEGGVLGVLPGIVGTWQANETLKLLLAIGKPLVGRLAIIDALAGQMREFRIERDPACPLCGEHPTITDIVSVDDGTRSVSRDAQEVEAAGLDEFFAAHPAARILDVREPHEAVLGPAPRSVAIPASRLEAQMHELDTAAEYVVACRVGSRSLWAAQRLREAGFGRIWHLHGGLLALAARDESFEFF